MERREKYSATGATQAEPANDDVAEAIRLLVAQGYIVTVGPTGGALFPHHLVIYRLRSGTLFNQTVADFAPELLELAGRT